MTWLQTRRTQKLNLLAASRSTLSAAPALVLLSSALLGLTAAAAVAAEPSKEPNWYQIELVVFTQPQQHLNAEYWQEQLQPRFTPNAIQLRPSTGFEPQQISEPSGEATPEAAGIGPRLVRALPQPLPQEYSDGAFTLLNQEQLSQQPELNDPLPPIDIVQLKRQGHRILFQGQWRQPVHEKQQARSIVIRGGQRLEPDYFELEGDIQLSLSRYLHLRPNLYFTLPLPPEWQPRHPRAIEALASIPPALGNSELSASAELAPAAATAPLPVDPLQQLQPPIPRTRYLMLPLDQPRRMRRNELHYIDHPLFGMLIRFTAYTPEPKVLVIPVKQTPSASTASTSVAGPT